MADTPLLEGVYPILVTPFDDEEQIDLPSFDKVVRFMAAIGSGSRPTVADSGVSTPGLADFPASSIAGTEYRGGACSR